MSWQNKALIFIGILILCLAFSNVVHGEEYTISYTFKAGDISLPATIPLNATGTIDWIKIDKLTRKNDTASGGFNISCNTDVDNYIIYAYKGSISGVGDAELDQNIYSPIFFNCSEANSIEITQEMGDYPIDTETQFVITYHVLQKETEPIQATYHNWLFINGIIIFFLSIMSWGVMFRPSKKQ